MTALQTEVWCARVAHRRRMTRGEVSSRGGRVLPRDPTEQDLVRAVRELLDDIEDPDRIAALIVAVGRYQ